MSYYRDRWFWAMLFCLIVSLQVKDMMLSHPEEFETQFWALLGIGIAGLGLVLAVVVIISASRGLYNELKNYLNDRGGDEEVAA